MSDTVMLLQSIPIVVWGSMAFILVIGLVCIVSITFYACYLMREVVKRKR